MTTSGTASTPRTPRVVSCGCRRVARSTRPRSPTTHDDAAGHHIHLPSPSFYPFILAARAADPRLRRGVPQPVARDPGPAARALRRVRLGPRAVHRARAAERAGTGDERSGRPMTTIDERPMPELPAVPARPTTSTTTTPAPPTPSWGCGCSCRRTACSSVPSSARSCSTATAAGRRARRPADVFNIPFTSVTSFILLMSSLTMVLALAAIQRGDHRRFRIWMIATVFFGVTFIGGQIFEFTEFTREGPQPRHQPVRLELLRAHRPARRARHHRHHLAPLAVGPVDAGAASGQGTPSGSRSPASTGTSSTWCGS